MEHEAVLSPLSTHLTTKKSIMVVGPMLITSVLLLSCYLLSSYSLVYVTVPFVS